MRAVFENSKTKVLILKVVRRKRSAATIQSLPSQCIDPFCQRCVQYQYYSDLPVHAVLKLHLKLPVEEGKPEHGRELMKNQEMNDVIINE